jgi:hypothetical protein
VLDLLLHEVVDLTVAAHLESWGLTASDLLKDDMVRCQEVAGIAERLGVEAIRWASATGAGQSFAVFVDQLRPGSHVEIRERFDLRREMLDAISKGTALTTLLPALRDMPLLE